MVRAGQFRRACATSLLGAAIASVGLHFIAGVDANGDDARATLKAMSDCVSDQKSIAATTKIARRAPPFTGGGSEARAPEGASPR